MANAGALHDHACEECGKKATVGWGKERKWLCIECFQLALQDTQKVMDAAAAVFR